VRSSRHGVVARPVAGSESVEAVLRARRSGVTFEVRTTPDLEDEVRRRLPPGALVGDDIEPQWRYSLLREGDEIALTAGGGRPDRLPHLVAALDLLEDRLRFDVACTSSEHLFVHAGVVGLDGRALVIPGSSGTGKSHLVAALVAAGALYYSDEFALIDSQGRVHPYAQKLSLAKTHGRPKRRTSPVELGGRVGIEPLPVGLILVTRYRPGAQYRPAALSPAQTVLELLAHVVRAREAPREALERLQRVALCARALTSERGDAGRLADEILALEKTVQTASTSKEIR